MWHVGVVGLLLELVQTELTRDEFIVVHRIFTIVFASNHIQLALFVGFGTLLLLKGQWELVDLAA